MDLVFGSTQTIYIPLTKVTDALGNPYDPTGDPVSVAFSPNNPPNPTDGDFNTAAWVAGALVPTVEILGGPQNGGIPLARGTYTPVVKITDNPEVPWLAAAGVVNVK